MAVKDSWADDDDLGMKKVPVPEFLLNGNFIPSIAPASYFLFDLFSEIP